MKNKCLDSGWNVKALKEVLALLLDGGLVHSHLDYAVKRFPERLMNTRIENIPYSPWQLLEHMRISQSDTLKMITKKGYNPSRWPEGYWPSRHKTANKAAWKKTVASINKDLSTLNKIVNSPGTDLFHQNPKGQTILREIISIADHNSHHLGQLILLRRALGAWPPK
jgi:hypothetical protein